MTSLSGFSGASFASPPSSSKLRAYSPGACKDGAVAAAAVTGALSPRAGTGARSPCCGVLGARPTRSYTSD